jgi:N-acetylmuramoyl-L-alanine amidase
MNLRKLILTENACYKAGKTIVPKGIMVHSTAANNPYLKRYVGPDDGLLGKNQYNNHWNQDRPDGRQVCPHAFIGKLADGSIATYQTLPWNHRGWHAGGDANNSHLGFEICEDNLTDVSYFNAVYQEAIELCVYLCRLYNLTEKNIIDHSEGYKLGIASNHRDPGHWLTKHGKSMDTFRTDVKKVLIISTSPPLPSPPLSTEPKKLYRVQVGAYSVRANAYAMLEKVKAAGFKDAFIKTDRINSICGTQVPLFCL